MSGDPLSRFTPQQNTAYNSNTLITQSTDVTTCAKTCLANPQCIGFVYRKTGVCTTKSNFDARQKTSSSYNTAYLKNGVSVQGKPMAMAIGATSSPLVFSLQSVNAAPLVVDIQVRDGREALSQRVRLWKNLGPGYAQRFQVTACGQLNWMETDMCIAPDAVDAATGIAENTNAVTKTCNCLDASQRFIVTNPDSAGASMYQLSTLAGEAKCLSLLRNSASTTLAFTQCTTAASQQFVQHPVPTVPTDNYALSSVVLPSGVTAADIATPVVKMDLNWDTWFLGSNTTRLENLALEVGSSVILTHSSYSVSGFFMVDQAHNDMAVTCNITTAQIDEANAVVSSAVGTYLVQLKDPGRFYFISTDPDECLLGRYLQLTVSYLSPAEAAIVEPSKSSTGLSSWTLPVIIAVCSFLVVMIAACMVSVYVYRRLHKENESSQDESQKAAGIDLEMHMDADIKDGSSDIKQPGAGKKRSITTVIGNKHVTTVYQQARQAKTHLVAPEKTAFHGRGTTGKITNLAE